MTLAESVLLHVPMVNVEKSAELWRVFSVLGMPLLSTQSKNTFSTCCKIYEGGNRLRVNFTCPESHIVSRTSTFCRGMAVLAVESSFSRLT